MSQAVEMGKRIKEYRLRLGYTREEVAEKLDLTPRFYYDLELGLKGMSLNTLCKICSTLKISSDYILFGDQSEEPGIAEYISLYKQCPVDKRTYLLAIVSEFNQAMNVDTSSEKSA